METQKQKVIRENLDLGVAIIMDDGGVKQSLGCGEKMKSGYVCGEPNAWGQEYLCRECNFELKKKNQKYDIDRIQKRIFVYGTLRKNYGLNGYLDKFKFLGTGKINGYKMYSNGSYPMIIEGEGEIVGEVYEIVNGENEISILDRIECQYDRKKINVKLNKETIKAEAYVWRGSVNQLKRIPSGNWVFNLD